VKKQTEIWVIYSLLFAFIAVFTFQDVYGQTILKPGESVNMMCTSCPSAPTRLPDVKVVDPSGNGDYTTVKDAAGNAQPGLTILVKNGTYNSKINITTSGTETSRIILKPYPGHSPVLDFTGSPDSRPNIEITADYITVKGFEIRNGWDGIKIEGDNNTIRDNYIHDNDYNGILIVNAGENIIEHNKIAHNGTAPGKCVMKGSSSPRHCHGIYISQYKCGGGSNGNVIRSNHILNHGGSGIQWNGDGCTNRFLNTVVEKNRFENNSWRLALYYGVDNSSIKHNNFISHSRPNTNNTSYPFISIWGSENNTIESNTFYATMSDTSGIQVYYTESENNIVNKNMWKLNYSWWVWAGTWRDDWLAYQQATGWDKDGEVTVAVSQ